MEPDVITSLQGRESMALPATSEITQPPEQPAVVIFSVKPNIQVP